MLADVVGVGKLTKVNAGRREADAVDELFLLLGEDGASQRCIRLSGSTRLTWGIRITI